MPINGSSTHLHIALLGGFHVSRAGRTVAGFRSDKARALFVYLLMQPRRACARAELAALLWPEQPERVARHNLSQALLLLKKALHDESGPPVLRLDGDRVAIDPACAPDVDAHVLASVARDASRDEIRRALDCYSGDFLAHALTTDSAEFELWVTGQRERLRVVAVSLCERLCDLALAARDHDDLLRYARRWIELAPWQERPHRHVMLALIERGERAAMARHYETLCRSLAQELRVEPEPETRALFARASEASPASSPIHASRGVSAHIAQDFRLPEPLNICIGRDTELTRLDAWIGGAGSRVITLTGAPGVGKTRLALEVARLAQDRFADGACLIEMSSCACAPQMLEALALRLHVSIGADSALESLCQMLRVRRMLLVLDNLEQAADAGALVTTLIERCPNLHIVATSREPLHARYERVFAVDALSLMDDVNGAAAALQLFLSRANAVDHRFDPDVDALLAIRQICARLEGNPLGIELAATWVGALDVADIAREIGENVDFARANFSDVPERHRSLRAAFEHSWSLLSATEQRMLRCLSLFAGEFTREAALSVSGAPISALLSLVNRSLLRRIPGGRYCLHVFVREFAALKADDAPADRRDAEARFCDVFAERAHALLDDFKGRKQREALAALTRDLPDMLRAWRIALAQSRFKNVMRMIEVLEWFYETAERLPEAGAFAQDAVEQLERASALTPMPPSMDAQLTLAWLRGVHGWVRFRQNDMAGMALVHESERWIADLIDPADAFHQNVHALALLRVAYLTAFAGQIDAADAVLPACIEASRRAGRPWLVAMARACAGMLPLMRGDPAAARELLMANLDEWRAVGDAHGLMTCLSFLTNALQALGRADEALKLIGDDLLFVLGYGNRWSVTMATASLARVAQAQGDHAQARQLYLDSIRIFADAGDAWGLTSAMVDFAMFTRDAGDCAKAAELLRAVLDHGSSAPPVAARAAQLLAEIESCEAAPVRVAAGTLWDLAARLTWQRYPNLAGCQPARLM